MLQELIDEAKKEYGEITFCGNKKSWKDCVTYQNGYMVLWFNVEKDTHIVRTKLTD